MDFPEIDGLVAQLIQQEGPAYTAGFLESQLYAALSEMPKSKKERFIATFKFLLKDKLFVTVQSLMTGAKVKIRMADKGTCLDPSTERYWSM